MSATINSDSPSRNAVLLLGLLAWIGLAANVGWGQPGQLMFSQPNYVVNEDAGLLPVTVLRTNGQSGTVQVNFSTVPGTALPAFNYLTTNGVLTFGPDQTSQTITVPILEENQIEGNRSFSLMLFDAAGGATLIEPTAVPVTIIDDDVGVSFASPVYMVPETSGDVSLTLYRQNGTNGVTTVHYTTTNLTAQAGVNYVGVTNGTVTFNLGDDFKSFVVGVLHDSRVTGDVSFGVNLFDPTSPAQVFNYGSAVVNISDADSGLSFGSPSLLVITNADLTTATNASYRVLRSTSTNVLITVLRTNANTGTVSVRYATVTNANDTAEAPVDYAATTGLLTFSNGVTVQSFSVPINPNHQVRGDRTFSIILTNQTPGAQLMPPSVATVTIIDDLAGLSFSSPTYSKEETGGSATIAVTRSNFTNSTVSVNFATVNGTAQVGVNYFPTNGTLTFANGETVKTFAVQLRDDGMVNGDHTVLLGLANPVGNAALIDPSAAILTVVEADGSLVIPAGASLISESGPVNGVIDPGETVTLLFALRNRVGTNTANLVATLQTNGISNPSEPQNYGSLVAYGPSAARPFTFQAGGVNGQTLTVTFQLQDGSINRGQAAFNFSLGKTAATYSNPGAIAINDNPAAPPTTATPYPSTINVSGLGGQVTKATVTLTNFNHTWPSDVDVLLVSPPTLDSSTGRKSLLMAKAGSSYTANNVTLTFDDAATSSLPRFSQLISGTNRPTSYAANTPLFPSALTPPPPYATNLSLFNGMNPNGAWSLYVIDDASGNSGSISKGWFLSLTTASAVPAAADVGIAMTVAPATVVISSNLTYTIAVTNFGPSSATNIVVTDTLPPGTALATTDATQGTVTNAAGLVTWNVGSLDKDATATLTLVALPSLVGTITHSATVTAATTDPNPDDDVASVVTTVIAPIADLALGLADSPDPALTGGNLTYTLTVTNLGPATAPGVMVVDTLPPTVNFVSAWPSNNYTVVGQVVTFLDLGNLGGNQQATAMIVVKPMVAGTLTNTATCSSAVTDPRKGNNNAGVKTTVMLFDISLSHGDGNLTLSWPAAATNTYLESTANLQPPVIWAPATNPPPSLEGGQMTVTLPVGSDAKFFRLHGTP